MEFRRIALVGDDEGIDQLLEVIPQDRIVCLVGAAIRPQYLEVLANKALLLGVPFLVQPKYKSDDYPHFLKQFQVCTPDFLYCNSYSMILREDLLQEIGFNAVNVHGALLPKNRGPNPTQWALIRGELQTGVTIHEIAPTMDTGGIVAQSVLDITETDTWLTLTKKLRLLALELMQQTAPKILNGNWLGVAQDEQFATVNPRLTPDFPKIDFKSMSDREIYNLIRAQVAPLKGAYLEINGSCQHFDQRLEEIEITQLREQYCKIAAF